MNCRDLDSVCMPYLDGELVAEERAAIEVHLTGCPACARRLEVERLQHDRLQALMRQASPPAPAALRARLASQLHQVERQRGRRQVLALVGVAASVALLSAVGWQEYRGWQRRLYMEEAATRHARGWPLEILQPSPEVLEAWFGGKLDHRVSVPRFPNATAAGARLITVRDKQGAYIRYTADRPSSPTPRQIGLFVIGDKPRDVDVGALAEPERGNSNGYNVVSWRDGDVVYELVTDLDEDDLRTLLPSTPGQQPVAPPRPVLDVRNAALQH
jgi:anti-sigma factor RsiW